MVVRQWPALLDARRERLVPGDGGWDVVNMTGQPEAVLCAELGLRYESVALVTDYDAGVDGHTPVTMDEVLTMVRSSVARVQSVIAAAVGLVPPEAVEPTTSLA